MRFTQKYMLAVWRVDGGGEVAIPFADIYTPGGVVTLSESTQLASWVICSSAEPTVQVHRVLVEITEIFLFPREV